MCKKLVFRADGNREIGLGHLYRLFALVEIYLESYECIFLTSHNSSLSVIPQKYNPQTIPLKISIANEPEWLQEHYTPEDHLIVADGYQFTSEYQKELKGYGFDLIYIDDLVSEHMYANVVVNHSPGILAKHYKKEEYTQLALGTSYAMLRPEFISQTKKSRAPLLERNVFVCFGGSDPNQFSYKVSQALLQFEELDKIFVVLGASNQDEDLIKLEKLFPQKLILNKNLNSANLLELMLKSEFALVPSSTVLYELCCANTPCLSGYYVENQRRIHEGFLAERALYSMGNIEHFRASDFVPYIEDILVKDDHEVQLNNQRKLFDGNIKSRFLKIMNDLC